MPFFHRRALISFMQDLVFSQNWNNKLDNKAFTTLRLEDNQKYYVGAEKMIKLKSHEKGKAVIKGVKPLMIDQINDYIAYVDTGYDAAECKNILRRMYGSRVDFSQKRLVLVLLVYV
jgi:hypothetical protein